MARKRVKRNRGKTLILLALLCLPILFVAASYGYLRIVFPGTQGPGSGQDVFVDVPWGAGAVDVAERVEQAGAAKDPWLLALYLRASGLASRIQAGRHRLQDNWTMDQVASALTRRGLSPEVRVTLREGLSRFDYATELDRLGIVAKGAFLQATEDEEILEELGIEGENAEGYLFPETYRMKAGSEASFVVRRLLETFNERTAATFSAEKTKVADFESKLGILAAELEENKRRTRQQDKVSGRHAVIIVASIVEAETARADERRKVAAVFCNRLFSESFPFRRLQADPTVRYGCVAEPDGGPSCEGTGRAITKAQLEDSLNRYNTYTHAGLPPGPIGNPSLESIEAVLRPAPTKDLYFVAQGDGRHCFSTTLEEHNKAVQRYRQIQKQ